MILKKDVPSYVIWALFAAFNVLLIAVFGLYSGLFPTSDTTETMLFTGMFTILVGGICFVVSFLFDRLSVYFLHDKKLDSRLAYLILFVLLLIGGTGLRGYILYSEGTYVRSGISLFETASVTSGGMIKADSIWKLCYLLLMRAVLFFTGDVVTAALVYQLVIRMVFFALIGIAVRIMSGRLSSLIVLAFLMFLPPFITVHILDATSFFELFVALELIFLALYFSSISRAGQKSKGRFFLYALLGVCLGALFYMDAGTILFWSPMILMLFMFKKIREVLLSFLCIIPGAVIGFGLVLVVWDGYDVIGPALSRWSARYFADILSIESFEVIGESSSSVYAVLYLVLAIVMLCGTFAFLFHKKTTRLVPFMLQALLVCLVAPIMGETNVNTLRMMTLMCIIVIGGGLACMFTSYDTSDFDLLMGTDNEADDLNAEQKEFDGERGDADDLKSEQMDLDGERGDTDGINEIEEVSDNTEKTEEIETKPSDSDGENEYTENAESSTEADSVEALENNENILDNTTDAEVAVANNAPEEDEFEQKQLENDMEELMFDNEKLSFDDEKSSVKTADVKEINADNKTKTSDAKDIKHDSGAEKVIAKEEVVRYVPEGMVVPMGTEDDEDTPRSGRQDILERRRQMSKMQSPSGKLKVGRKVIANREFDIEVTDGDDFDLF